MANRFFKGYYVCNVLLIAAYFALRSQRLHPRDLGDRDILGFTRESSIYFSIFLICFARVFSAQTLDAFLATVFKAFTLGILLCLWFMDSGLCKAFAALFLAVTALCPQPRFAYPRSIATLNHQSFESRVASNTHKSYYVVWTHATWSPRCTQLAPIFANLAKRLKHPRVTFAKLDVGRWGEAAKRLKVSVSPTSNQLPCVIVYRRGKEVARVPKTVGSGSNEIEARWRNGFSANDLWRELDMDNVKSTVEKWETQAQNKLRDRQIQGKSKSQ